MHLFQHSLVVFPPHLDARQNIRILSLFNTIFSLIFLHLLHLHIAGDITLEGSTEYYNIKSCLKVYGKLKFHLKYNSEVVCKFLCGNI